MEESLLIEAEYLIQASEHCSDEMRGDKLNHLIKEILFPLWEKRNPRSLYLKARLPNLGESERLSDGEFDDEWSKLIKEASDGGIAEAQYKCGCELYETGKSKEAVDLYEKSASKGYPPAQWCFGIDVLNGIGREQNQELGLQYITLSASQAYSYAVKFLIKAYERGDYGFNTSQKMYTYWKNVTVKY
jgi:TPR repeat protein